MERELKLALGVIGTLIIVLIAISNMALMVDLHTFRLILTSEGCTYAQSIGLQVEKANGQCSVQARFRPYVISSGGVLQLDNDKKISITNSMLLATSQSDTDLPPTASQQAGLKWFWAWLVVAVVVGSANLLYFWCGKRGERKSANKHG